MEASNRAVEGEQPDSNQNELKKETTAPLKNENPVGKRELKKASEILGARSTSGKSPASSSKDRGTASGSSKQEKHQTAAPGNKSRTAPKAVPRSSTSKAVAPGGSDEDRFMDREPGIETALVDQTGSGTGEKLQARQRADSQRMQGNEIISPPLESERNADQPMEGPDRDNELEILKRKAEKAQKKVAKLKKKYKKAKQKEVKRNKLNLLKDKLIKANAKLKRRKKKLEKANG